MPVHLAESGDAASVPARPPRRNLLVALAAGSASAAAWALMLVPGVRVFLDPLREPARPRARRIRVATLDAIPPDGLPRRFQVIDQRVDAWTLHPPEPIGAVFLLRNNSQEKPRCYSATCPHLGCSVDFKTDQDQYQCPCHASGFAIDGRKLFGPSPRPLDELAVEVQGREVWVLFKQFRSGIEAQVEI